MQPTTNQRHHHHISVRAKVQLKCVATLMSKSCTMFKYVSNDAIARSLTKHLERKSTDHGKKAPLHLLTTLEMAEASQEKLLGRRRLSNLTMGHVNGILCCRIVLNIRCQYWTLVNPNYCSRKDNSSWNAIYSRRACNNSCKQEVVINET